MEVDTTTSTPGDATNRRKSGRAIQKPVLYQEDPRVAPGSNGSAKRKRPDRVNDDAEDVTDESSTEEQEESDPDEEELKEQRRRARNKPSQKKPAAKKPKRNDDSEHVALAMRPAANGVKRSVKSKKPARARVTGPEMGGQGLYGRSQS
jgi:cohesin complex subunit SA-1/2